MFRKEKKKDTAKSRGRRPNPNPKPLTSFSYSFQLQKYECLLATEDHTFETLEILKRIDDRLGVLVTALVEDKKPKSVIPEEAS